VTSPQGQSGQTKLWLVFLLVAGIAILALTVAHVPAGFVAAQRPRFGPAEDFSRALGSGWHIVFRPLSRVELYEAGEQTFVFDSTRPTAKESEAGNLVWPGLAGSRIEAAGSLEYSLTESQLEQALTASGGDLYAFLRERLGSALEGVTDSERFQVPTAAQRDEIRQLALERLESADWTIGSFAIDRIGLSGTDTLLGYPQAARNPKLLWLCVDSFDWDVIDPLIAAGRMPRMARLKQEGSWGKLQTITPVLSPVVWTSMATGMLPEKHGIFDFIATDPTTGAIVPVTSSLRQTDAFWNILSHSGVSVGVVAWWATFPAEKVDGFMATDRIAYQLFKDKVVDASSDDPLKTYPSALFDRIEPLIVPPSSIDDQALETFMDYSAIQSSFSAGDRERVNELRTVIAATETYRAIADELFSSIETDVRVLYYEAPDTASHLFMPFVPPTTSIDSQHVEWFGRVVPAMYEEQDRWIGEAIDRYADENTTILITSDHGFKTGEERPDSDARIGEGKAAEWHTRDGLVLLAGPEITRGERVLGASILDVLPTVLALYGLPPADDMDGKVLRSAFRADYREALPETTIATYNLAPREVLAPGTGLSAEAAEEHLAKLRALGYIKQTAPTADINRGTSALAAGDFDQAIEAFQAVLQQGDKSAVRMSLARALRLAKRYDEAEVQLGHVLEMGDFDAPAHAELAAVARNRGDLGRAETEIRAALMADPQFVDAHMQRAKLAETRKDWDAAIASYYAALEIEPSKSDALNQIGVLLQRRGKVDEAIVVMQQAIERNPDLAAPYNNLGLLYYSQKRLDQAAGVLDTGLAMRPDSPILLNSRGSLHYEKGETREAIASFEAALASDPAYPDSISNLAIIYQDLQDAEQAMRWWSRLVEVEPTNVEARVSLALIQVREGDMDAAVATLEASVDEAPEHLRSLITLGRAYREVGRTEDARTMLERALRIDPDQPRVRAMLAGFGP
jgi:Tfp pilus assembly protein PilF/predicted AlkP superfamily phosphohydrolase/phosphomutase